MDLEYAGISSYGPCLLRARPYSISMQFKGGTVMARTGPSRSIASVIHAPGMGGCEGADLH